MSEIYGNIVMLLIMSLVFAVAIIGNYIVERQQEKEIEEVVYKIRFAEKMRSGVLDISWRK